VHSKSHPNSSGSIATSTLIEAIEPLEVDTTQAVLVIGAGMPNECRHALSKMGVKVYLLKVNILLATFSPMGCTWLNQ
jgi:heterodisulfide reductase subunit A-like polyferredoxin